MQQNKNVSELKVGSILSYVNLFISCVIPLAYTPIMLRILGQEEYGLYSLSNSVTGYLALFSFGMGNTIIRYVTQSRLEGDHTKLENLVGMFISIYLVLASLVGITGVVLSKNSGVLFGEGLSSEEIDKLSILIIIMTANTALVFIASVYGSIVIAYEKYIFRKIIDCVASILAPIFNLIILYVGYATIGMAVVALLMQIFNLLIYWWFCGTKLHIHARFSNMPWNRTKEIFGFSVFVFLSSIIDMLYWATDKVLLGAMLGSVAVAIYNVGGTFTAMLQNMSSAISGVFGTRITEMVLSNCSMKQISAVFIRIGRIQYLIVSLILSGYVVFGQSFIHFWAGEAYQEAYYIGLLTMIPLAVPLIQSIALSTVVAQNKHQFRAIIYAIIAVVNVIGTYILIPEYGIYGAAICTAFSYIVGNGIIMNIYYYKVTKLNIPLFWCNIIKMSIVPVSMSFVAKFVFAHIVEINSFVSLGVYIILFTAIFILLSWYISMNEYEKTLCVDLLRKINIFRRRKTNEK